MASLRDIRKRIKSVKNTQKITKAMKMVAAAKLRRAQDAAGAAVAYADGYQRLVQRLAATDAGSSHELLEARPEAKRAEVVVMTSSRGLCGGFNSNLLKRLAVFMADEVADYEEVCVTTLGRKGNEYVTRRYTLRQDVTGIFADGVPEQEALSLSRELAERFLSGEVDHVYVLYNRFESVLTQTPTLNRLLPAVLEDSDGGADAQLTIEPDPASLLDYVLRQQLFLSLYQAVLDTEAGEHASRMTAMDGATKNAGEMIDKTTLVYNRARQAAITSELVEIISGAEAL